MINIALLGFGRIGQMHAENINRNKDLNLLYVYDKIKILRKKAKKLYNCSVETNYKKVFQNKKVDIINVIAHYFLNISFV